MKNNAILARGLKLEGSKIRLLLLPFAAFVLAVLAFVFVPYLEASLRASAAGSGSAEVTIGVAEAWARLSTSGNVVMSTGDITSSGSIISGRANVIAATNSPSGYKLYLSASDPTNGSSADLVNSVSSTARITPISTASLSTLGTVNTWGYATEGADRVDSFSSDYKDGSLESKLFKGVSHLASVNSASSNGLIAQATAPRSFGAITDIYYAAYVNTSTAAGTYSTNLTYTLVADFVPTATDPNDPENNPSADPNKPSNSDDQYAYTDGDTTYYYGNEAGYYYSYDAGGNKTVTALGVNNSQDDGITTIANLNDGSITWAAIATIAGASATFLAIALLRDRDEEDEEE